MVYALDAILGFKPGLKKWFEELLF